MNSETLNTLDIYSKNKYKYGFVTDIDNEKPKIGLNEDTIKFISLKKNEPDWMLEWRLKAFSKWKKMKEPKWANLNFPEIDYQDICFVTSDSYRDLVKNLNPSANKKGLIYDTDKNILGTHEGISNYTIGQRKGIGISGSKEALYVIDINKDQN